MRARISASSVATGAFNVAVDMAKPPQDLI
jgi:hypothetical protein